MNLPPSPFVFFDLDGTLLDHDAAVGGALRSFHARHRRDLALGEEAVFASRWRAASRENYDRYLRGELSWHDQRRARVRGAIVADLSDVAVDALFAEYYGLYREGWALFPDVLPALASLETRGAAFGLITNGDLASQGEKIGRAGIEDRFAVVVASSEAGLSKPDPRIFEEAARRAGRPLAACLHVGDRLDADALGATRAGMTGVWLDREDRGDASQGPLMERTGSDPVRSIGAPAGVRATRGVRRSGWSRPGSSRTS